MGAKDISEKILLAYDDVFSDIINVLLFKGKRVIKPNELVDRTPRAAYKADGKLREIERDVMKEWVKNHIRIACLGLENQTVTDPYMPLRGMGYDGTEYRNQLRDLKAGKTPAPVITLVLYFGYEKHWDGPLTLHEALDVREEFRPYVADYRINLFEIAWLKPEQVKLFQSDFRVVADYFVQMRMNRDYKASKEELDHIQAVLQLMNVMDHEHRFEARQNERDDETEEVKTVSEWLDRVIRESEERGRREEAAKAENKGLRTLWRLVNQNRISIEEAADDAELTVDEFIAKGIALKMAEPSTTYQADR